MIVHGSVLYGADDVIKRWVTERSPGFAVPQDCTTMGIIKRKRLVAAVLFERYNGAGVEANIVALPGSRWADRRTLFALGHYVFLQLRCEVVTVSVAASNLASLNLTMKLGFKPVAFVKFAAHDGGALVILQLSRNDAGRWLDHGPVLQNPESA